jgi:hypothetical protein
MGDFPIDARTVLFEIVVSLWGNRPPRKTMNELALMHQIL